MTSRNGTPPHIYFPTLHRELVHFSLPETVLFLDPGLPQTLAEQGLYRPEGYPLPREDAARMLGELLGMGEALDMSSATGKEAARTRFAGGGSLPGKEAAALARFAASGDRHEAPSSVAGPRLAAHAVLLLAWDLEERLVEIDRLRREVAEAAKPLAESLGDSTDEDNANEAARAFAALDSLPETVESDWRLTLAAAAPFLPGNAVLVTAHAGIRSAMLESGMLHPLPEDAAHMLEGWSENAKQTLLWAQAPLWRVLGRSRPPEDAPWLLAAPEMILCPQGEREP